jgi:bifunctional pyridoxal-dependent enzyme with beta-cystathionase and maltose regulon repressor activities
MAHLIKVDKLSFVFYDESNFSLANSYQTLKTWQPRNETFDVAKPIREAKSEGHTTLQIAVSDCFEKGILWRQAESTSTDSVISFFELVQASLKNNVPQKPVLVYDSHVTHTSLEVLRWCEANDFQVIVNPVYSPVANLPAERTFGLIKYRLKKWYQALSFDEMQRVKL